MKLESFVLTFLKSTFHIHICGRVIGVMHAWKGGKLVSNEGTNRSGILGLFYIARGRLIAFGVHKEGQPA